ncbi:hypothetical protein ABT112_26815 [Streptomyces sp. NPDC002055]|uniref:hypothetical protein n=1 Tax=Streptomyces sp. NPDC002055 TaxID=3154534 RepID=UPI00331CD4CE
MLRIISTSRLAELENLESAFPMVRSKCDGLEEKLEAERRRSQGLETELDQAGARNQEEQAATARFYQERLTAARRAERLSDRLRDKAQERVRELTGEIEQMKAQLAAASPLPSPEGVIARFENLVRASIDLTLHVKDLGAGYPQAELQLVLLCAGCGYTEEKSRQSTGRPEARRDFVNDDYQGGRLKRWAQEHAAECRAVALPAPATACPIPLT